jgi:hypothetical protein
MESPRIFEGEMGQHHSPDWTPLERLIGTELMGHFMWMGEIELSDGTAVHAYKHRSTRRYFHLGEDGRAFRYTKRGAYREIDPSDALVDMFEGWGSLTPIESERAALAEAFRRASDLAA